MDKDWRGWVDGWGRTSNHRKFASINVNCSTQAWKSGHKHNDDDDNDIT